MFFLVIIPINIELSKTLLGMESQRGMLSLTAFDYSLNSCEKSNLGVSSRSLVAMVLMM